MRRRLAAGIVIALGVLAAVVGVRTSYGAKAGPITLTMWSYDNQDPGLEPVLKQLSKEFEQQRGKLEAERTAISSREDTLARQLEDARKELAEAAQLRT